MKERPILFSSPMVRAILEGRKTMTRRVVKPDPAGCWKKAFYNGDGFHFETCGGVQSNIIQCPYGHPGDRLWVRETFRLPSRYDDATPEELAAQVSRTEIRYLADGDVDLNGKTRPAIFLRYGWHRILLEVVSVRVERVRDIKANEVYLEGIEPILDVNSCVDYTKGARFIRLWDSINAKRGYGWAVNPWVWVVEFKRVTP